MYGEGKWKGQREINKNATKKNEMKNSKTKEKINDKVDQVDEDKVTRE